MCMSKLNAVVTLARAFCSLSNEFNRNHRFSIKIGKKTEGEIALTKYN